MGGADVQITTQADLMEAFAAELLKPAEQVKRERAERLKKHTLEHYQQVLREVEEVK